ncbi:MAG: hypothetical protein IJV43_02275 [Oscillospiraceae bacterium]|nr:hypothetical protein [Oscillospiraceae bacterium]
MQLYKKLYFGLFGKVEDAVILLDDGNVWEAKRKLLDALEAAENAYIEADEEPTEEIALTELAAQMRKAVGRLSSDERKSLGRFAEQNPNFVSE